MPRPATTAKNRLLVEGQDDLYAIAHLIDARHAVGRSAIDFNKPTPAAPFIEQHNGVENLLKAGVIEGRVKVHERVGIVLDADGFPLARWLAARDRLAAAGLKLPPQPSAGGVVIDGVRSGWKVGVWLMPDNASPGALEEFLLGLIPPGDALWPLAQQSTASAETIERRFGATDGLKARLRCWLSWQEDPDAGVGPTLARGTLNPLHPSADPFVGWLDTLFG